MYFYAWQLLVSEIRLIFLGGPLPSNTWNRLSISHFSGCTFSPMDFHKYKYYLISLLNPICVHWTFHLWVFFAVDVVVAVIIIFLFCWALFCTNFLWFILVVAVATADCFLLFHHLSLANGLFSFYLMSSPVFQPLFCIVRNPVCSIGLKRFSVPSQNKIISKWIWL